MDPDADAARVTQLGRVFFALAGLFVVLLTGGTSLIFAGFPELGITLVALSPLALVAAGVLLVRD